MYYLQSLVKDCTCTPRKADVELLFERVQERW